MMIPIVTIKVNMTSNFIFTTLLSSISDGRESAVTAIISESTVPIPTPFDTRASATGRVPKNDAVDET